MTRTDSWKVNSIVHANGERRSPLPSLRHSEELGDNGRGAAPVRGSCSRRLRPHRSQRAGVNAGRPCQRAFRQAAGRTCRRPPGHRQHREGLGSVPEQSNCLSVVFGALMWSYPFLPRQLSATDCLTIGIPAFFLVLMSKPAATGRDFCGARWPHPGDAGRLGPVGRKILRRPPA